MSHIMNKHIAFCVILVTLFSCTTPKKLNRVMDKLPEAAAKECSVRFPIKESVDTVIVIDSSFNKAKEMEFSYLYYTIDSLLGKQVHDSIKKEIVTVFQEKKVPIIKYKYITRIQESTAKQQVILDSCNKMSSLLNKKLDSITQKLSVTTEKSNKYKSQRDQLYWWLLLVIAILFRKPILRLGRKLLIKH
jgi:uroporphyrinogen-III decarboxylase